MRLARAALDLLSSQQITSSVKGRFSLGNLPFLFVFHCCESLFDCVAQSLRRILNQDLFEKTPRVKNNLAQHLSSNIKLTYT